MKAVRWYGSKDIRVETVPDPEIVDPKDAIIRVTSTAICGSDLHLYNGWNPMMEAGDNRMSERVAIWLLPKDSPDVCRLSTKHFHGSAEFLWSHA